MFFNKFFSQFNEIKIIFLYVFILFYHLRPCPIYIYIYIYIYSTLDGTSLKLVDKFTYLGSSVSSTEKDIDTRLTKAWTAIDRR